MVDLFRCSSDSQHVAQWHVQQLNRVGSVEQNSILGELPCPDTVCEGLSKNLEKGPGKRHAPLALTIAVLILRPHVKAVCLCRDPGTRPEDG